METEEINIVKNLQKKILKAPKSHSEVKNPDLYQRINTFITVKNQNFYQRLIVFINILFEFYRVISCSLLILFIPQKCGNNICSISDKLQWNSMFYGVSLTYNFLTLLFFCFLYFLEMRRENVLIKYLDVNTELPYNKADVEKLLELMPVNKKQKIIYVHNYYQKYANIMIYVYTVNAILSGLIISQYRIPNQTLSTFITYILFILIKLNNVYLIANTEEYKFYSAYLTTNMQFNDLDKKFKQITNESK
jgi:hypothetical protein